MTLHGWVAVPEFGSVEQFPGWGPPKGKFYSMQYDDEGHADVMRAANAYIDKYPDLSPPERKLAKHLLSEEGAHTDLYQHQSNERWYVNTDVFITEARQIVQLLGLPSDWKDEEHG